MPKRAARRPSAPLDTFTIGEAAALLGVRKMTLRRWDAAGRFRSRRHPISGYRLYRRAAVLRLHKQIETGRAA